MNERTHTTNVLKHIRETYPQYVVFKHADRYSYGVPDWQVCGNGTSFFGEMKYLRTRDALRDIISDLQLLVCAQLERCLNGRCWIIVYEQSPQQLTIWSPRALIAHFRHTHIMPHVLRDGESAAGMLFSHGAIRVLGWPYDLVSRLIGESCRG